MIPQHLLPITKNNLLALDFWQIDADEPTKYCHWFVARDLNKKLRIAVNLKPLKQIRDDIYYITLEKDGSRLYRGYANWNLLRLLIRLNTK